MNADAPQSSSHNRMGVLDGWRAVSILSVLASHMLPLGPSKWMLNDAAGRFGMALFFTLSGFLITKTLIENDSVKNFLIRRFFRIVPLAWLGLAIAFTLNFASAEFWFSNFFFFANLPPQHLLDSTGHYWSLCVEVQFYLVIALLYAVFGLRGLYVLPVLCCAVTLHRMSMQAYADIVTWRRVDEILAGCTLALIITQKLGKKPLAILKQFNPWYLIGLLILCSLPTAGFLNYFRPYVAAILVGATLMRPTIRSLSCLESRQMAYIAKISFAIYVFHQILQHTWLGMDPDKLMKYVKRPLLLAITFVCAHISTFYFEKNFIKLGLRFSK